MLFHTHEFLLLLTCTGLAFALFRDARQSVLLAGSVLFYAYAGFGMSALFAAVVVFNYVCFRQIGPERGRGILRAAITLDLMTLGLFKYALFFLGIGDTLGLPVSSAEGWSAAHLLLPVGISFYTFQMIALLVDARRGTAPPVAGFRDFALFITFFPQLIAGPIMRGHELLPQLRQMQGPTAEQAAQGAVWFVIGLVKKVVFADLLIAPRVDALFANATGWDTPTSWLLGALFGFQIYFDFAGYCDMAVGLGKLFGIELRINFSTPYVSRSPSEFWSRWNITLSRWFGDYVYIPLGGSRVTVGRTAVNLLVTMLASGLWHGAGFTFVIWGALHGFSLVVFHGLRNFWPAAARAVNRGGAPAVIGWTFTYAVAVIGWVYFRASSVHEANGVVANMFGVGSGAERGDLSLLATFATGLLALHFLERAWWARADTLIARGFGIWNRLPGPAQALLAFPLLVALIGFTKKVHGAFIYFQF